MSARHRQAKKRMSEWAVLLPSLGESLRIASLLTAGQEHVVTPTQAAGRPIKVGDYVRWERSTDYWVEGDVTEAEPGDVSVELIVRIHGLGWNNLIGYRRRYLLVGEHAGTCHRVNRPTNCAPTSESPIAVGDYVRWERGPSAPGNWVEGEVTCVDSWCVEVCVHAKATERLDKIGYWTWLGPDGSDGCAIRRVPRPAAPPNDPLDVAHDGIPLGTLLRIDTDGRREIRTPRNWGHTWTPAQRAAVSAHWSAELRAKVAAGDAERQAREVSVLCQGDYDDDEPWGPR